MQRSFSEHSKIFLYEVNKKDLDDSKQALRGGNENDKRATNKIKIKQKSKTLGEARDFYLYEASKEKIYDSKQGLCRKNENDKRATNEIKIKQKRTVLTEAFYFRLRAYKNLFLSKLKNEGNEENEEMGEKKNLALEYLYNLSGSHVSCSELYFVLIISPIVLDSIDFKESLDTCFDGLNKVKQQEKNYSPDEFSAFCRKDVEGDYFNEFAFLGCFLTGNNLEIFLQNVCAAKCFKFADKQWYSASSCYTEDVNPKICSAWYKNDENKSFFEESSLEKRNTNSLIRGNDRNVLRRERIKRFQDIFFSTTEGRINGGGEIATNKRRRIEALHQRFIQKI